MEGNNYEYFLLRVDNKDNLVDSDGYINDETLNNYKKQLKDSAHCGDICVDEVYQIEQKFYIRAKLTQECIDELIDLGLLMDGDNSYDSCDSCDYIHIDDFIERYPDGKGIQIYKFEDKVSSKDTSCSVM